ncbi:MAG TPA: site-specific integrase [Acidimicrobiia bacterium]|nr:site-specific integrase [Acidimicrobiia bacterium]
MMKGTTFQRNKTWTVVIEGDRDPQTNKRMRHWKSGFRTKREAEAWKLDALNKIQRNEFSAPSKMTLAEYLTEWLDVSEMKYKPGTFSVMRRHLTNHVIAYIGSTKLQTLRTAQINALYKKLATNGNRTESKGLSIGTIKGVHSYLRKALSDAEKWDYIAKNPATNADVPKDYGIKSSGHEIWTRDELKKFLEASQAATDKYYPLWLFLATTGVRRGEALGLEWQDLNMETGMCTIRQTLSCVDHKPVFQTPKTKSSLRTIAIPKSTLLELRKHRKEQTVNRLSLGEAWDNSHDLVFTHEDGALLHPERVLKEFHRRSERYGVRRVRLHSLRHGWATFAGQAGISPNVMKDHLGHSSITITMDIYSHVLASQDQEAAEEVARAIFSGA